MRTLYKSNFDWGLYGEGGVLVYFDWAIGTGQSTMIYLWLGYVGRGRKTVLYRLGCMTGLKQQDGVLVYLWLSYSTGRGRTASLSATGLRRNWSAVLWCPGLRPDWRTLGLNFHQKPCTPPSPPPPPTPPHDPTSGPSSRGGIFWPDILGANSAGGGWGATTQHISRRGL